MKKRSSLVLSTCALLSSLGEASKKAYTHLDYTHDHDHDFIEQQEKDLAESGDHLYVHLITHTHDDVGWLKTPDEYYSGMK